MSAGENMNVQMIDRLTAVGAGVYHETKSALMLRPKRGGGFHQRGYFVGGTLERMLGNIGDVPFGQDEQMHRRLRIRVFNRDHAVLAMHDFRGYLAGNDLAENAVGVVHFGWRYSNAMCVSGLGTNPAMDDLTMTGTVV